MVTTDASASSRSISQRRTGPVLPDKAPASTPTRSPAGAEQAMPDRAEGLTAPTTAFTLRRWHGGFFNSRPGRGRPQSGGLSPTVGQLGGKHHEAITLLDPVVPQCGPADPGGDEC